MSTPVFSSRTLDSADMHGFAEGLLGGAGEETWEQESVPTSVTFYRAERCLLVHRENA